MTLLGTNFDSYSMVHDDYGTHAGNAEELSVAIRQSFHKMYTEHCPLTEWAEQINVDVDTIPQKGDYDLDEILKADYFFA